MGKAAKAHRAKVQKRNKKVKQEEYSLRKKWNEAFEKQMEEPMKTEPLVPKFAPFIVNK